MTVSSRRLLMAGAAVLIALGLLLGGAVLGNPGDAVEQEQSAGATPAAPGSIEALQAQLERLPGDYPGWATLGLLYVDRARTTLDPSWYAKAQGAFDQSLEVRGEDNGGAMAGLASLQAAQHQFDRAEASARAAIAINDFDATAYGVLTDALTELGRYDEAAEALQQMADIDPGYATLTRISYQRELRGDVDGARTAMQQALDTAASRPDKGFALYQLGELAWGYDGDAAGAVALWEQGLAQDPASLPLKAALARAAGAAGRTDEALAGWGEVTGRVPVQLYLVEHADLLRSQGDEQGAADQLELVETANALLESAGSVVDLESALFEADHGSPERAVAKAQAAYAVSPGSVFVNDAMAWALHAAGRSDEALPYADTALSLGMRRASFVFHRGMVLDALGRTEEAKAAMQEALEINPNFSIPYAAKAREVLAG